MENNAYLNLKNINKYFGKFHVLKDINISIKKGEFICLLGPSGCGKTSLLRIIAGLERENSGTISLENNDITKLSTRERNVGIVFQSYALFPNMTGEENITFGLKNKKLESNKIKEILNETVKLVQLEGIAKKYPSEMSGGQMQRIALARAIAMEPNILLLDEPLSALDAKVRSKLRCEIKELQKKLKITTIMVTHDQEEALSMGDRIVVMNSGKIEQIGTPEEIYNNPLNSFVADFIGTTNIMKLHGKEIMVRPEDLTLLKSEESNLTTNYRVKNIEFRGNIYRVTLKDKNNLILVDVVAKEFKKLSIKENDIMQVEITNKLNEKVG
ncbi:phosphonate ABC transporter ATP-binding protein [Clostridium baratii]|uniref:ATP-binding cassette domain-containing protein n=1 Tax=Clostridium baratii TaxID=1561 RepID=UPI0009A27CCC|nr:ATP-binding cassette domain-containing protein [Clostridium baratii]OPF50528.1 phosphonate ABC transporter ATP-binding protein [Clostridium baratii]OPF54226.1 phosphonate ABC transporter ATP-binding protein [Clostridium baratii]OPF58791.1 phosphonate ABC transporter ATP-binding protein [Clostridium baratii]OPF58837.1 phosphonate ABC transporter ATP-binding protein [Clostridium baratii]